MYTIFCDIPRFFRIGMAPLPGWGGPGEGVRAGAAHTTDQYRYVSCRWRRWSYVSAPSSRYMAPLAVWKVTVMFYEATGT